MNLEGFCSECEKSPRKDIQIIGGWADAIKPQFSTRGQWAVVIRRNLRPSRELVPFTESQIQAAYRRMKSEGSYLSKFTLETLIKFLV